MIYAIIIVHRSDTGATTIQTNQGLANFPEVKTRWADFYIQDEMELLTAAQITPGVPLYDHRIDPTGDTGYKPLPGNELRGYSIRSSRSSARSTSWTTAIQPMPPMAKALMPTSQQMFVSASDPFIGASFCQIPV